MNKKKILIIEIIIISLVCMSIIHELGHVLTCWLVGGKTLSVGYKDNIGVLYVENQYPNMFTRGLGALGGSLFNCIICLSLFLLLRKKDYSCSFLFVIWIEAIHWIISIILKAGDAWNMSYAFRINAFFIISIMIIIACYFYILFLKTFFSTLEQIR